MSLNAQGNTVIEQIERAYRGNTLNYSDSILNIDTRDSDSVKAAKNYFRALLYSDFQQSILLHSTNFSSFPNELYGMKSGIKLISVDFVNKEFDKALPKIERIDAEVLPEVVYWRAKIAQLSHNYEEAISLSQGFIRRHGDNDLIPQMWLVLLESYFTKNDLASFERNLQTFSNHDRYNEYKAYLLYLNGLLHEGQNNVRARNLFAQVITEFPMSQFRVQAEDRMYAMRATVDTPGATVGSGASPGTTVAFSNVVVGSYEELRAGAFYIQFGVFSTENAARNLSSTLGRDRIATFHITKPVGGRRLFAVVQGPFRTRADAQAVQVEYIRNNIQTFIFRKD
jgi:tetratricopeptide (TPR) repeat protein